MPDPIYIVAPTTKFLTSVNQASFADLGIQERKDLEAWVITHPEVLGEPLLIITSEFDRFDKSNRRLDVLALDENGTLVIVELKLDLSKTFADQQAIRYAAFCSTMTMSQLVQAMAAYRKCSHEEAETKILAFLAEDELPELSNQPRIILAAGALDDEELTSTVLWLRTFGVDITCIEIKPYKLPTTGELILVPRTIIPLPEAAGFMVRVEQKQSEKIQKTKENIELRKQWEQIATGFNALTVFEHEARLKKATSYLQMRIGRSDIHYEWLPLKSEGVLRVALHFENDDPAVNKARVNQIAAKQAEVREGVEYPFVASMWGKNWASAEFRIPWDETVPTEAAITEAIRVMQILVQRTWPTVQVMA